MNISSFRELRNRLEQCMDPYTSQPTIDAVAEYIRSMPDCPRWGSDWTDFWDSLDLLEIEAIID